VTNVLAILRLLPISDRAKDAEILALRSGGVASTPVKVLVREPPMLTVSSPRAGIVVATVEADTNQPITEPNRLHHLDIRKRNRLGGALHEYQHAA
jgi:hypothetical protein